MVTYQENPVLQVKKVYGGELSEDEIALLTTIQDIFRRILESQKGFNECVNLIAETLTKTIRINFNLYTVENVDVRRFDEIFNAEDRFLNGQMSSLTEKEIQFSQEVIEAIDFFMLSGVGFGLAVNVLYHDFTEIIHNGGLENAFNSSFSPKISGWAHYSAGNVGDPDEPED